MIQMLQKKMGGKYKFAKKLSMAKKKAASSEKKDSAASSGKKGSCAPPEPVSKEESALPDGEFVGLKCRVVHEDYVTIFGDSCTVLKQFAKFPPSVLVQVGTDVKKHLVRTEAIEIIDWLLPPSVPKQLNLNLGEKEELLSLFPDLCSLEAEGLTQQGRLSGDHLKLLDWIIRRDLIDTRGAAFIQPVLIFQFLAAELESTADAKEIREKAGQVLIQRFKTNGLIGVPVYAAPSDAEAHWTLLVIRKLNGDQVVCRYYDSLQKEAAINRTVSDDILSFMKESFPGMSWPDVLPPRSNTRSRQMNGIDCGVFVGYFWEGELRSFLGEGWSLPFPITAGRGIIGKMRGRVIQLNKQMLKIHSEKEKKGKAKAKAKGKAAVVEEEKSSGIVEVVDIEAVLLASKKVNEDLMKAADLKKLAELTFNQGIVPFYGCSRCRYNRGGCINYKCHPDKFAVHKEKYPEKYKPDSNELLPECLKKITNKELIAGGGKKVEMHME